MKADRDIDGAAQQFLPDNLSNDWKTAKIRHADGKIYSLVSQELISKNDNAIENGVGGSDIFTPYSLIGAIIVVMLLTSWKKSRYPLPHKLMMCSVWLITGLCGIILTAMIFSQHPTVSLNLQILLLNPLNLGMLVPALSHNRKYNLIILACMVLFIIGAAIQSYADGLEYLAFILLIVFIRDYMSQFKNKK